MYGWQQQQACAPAVRSEIASAHAQKNASPEKTDMPREEGREGGVGGLGSAVWVGGRQAKWWWWIVVWCARVEGVCSFSQKA